MTAKKKRRVIKKFHPFILVRVYRPEGYEDVCDELVLADFMEARGAFAIELLTKSGKRRPKA